MKSVRTLVDFNKNTTKNGTIISVGYNIEVQKICFVDKKDKTTIANILDDFGVNVLTQEQYTDYVHGYQKTLPEHFIEAKKFEDKIKKMNGFYEYETVQSKSSHIPTLTVDENGVLFYHIKKEKTTKTSGRGKNKTITNLKNFTIEYYFLPKDIVLMLIEQGYKIKMPKDLNSVSLVDPRTIAKEANAKAEAKSEAEKAKKQAELKDKMAKKMAEMKKLEDELNNL